MSGTPPAVEVLRRAGEGLWFLSETDAPFTPFFWPGDSDEELDVQGLERWAGTPRGASVETVELDDFFRNVAEVHEWHDVIQVAEVEKYRRLVEAIRATLEDVRVFRVGEISIDVYVVGRVDGGHAGLHTLVVET